MENWLTGLIAAGGIALGIYVLNSGSRLLREVISKKRAEAEAADKQVLAIAFEGAEKVLEAVTKATVSKFEHGVAAELREKVKAGEAQYEDLCNISEAACKEIIKQLKPELQTTLLECIGDLESYIKNQIEAVLPEIKASYAQSSATKKLAADIIKGNVAQNEAMDTQA